MKLSSPCLVLFVLLLTAGCGRKEISSLQRKQGANLMTEAQFALTLRDFARAETLLAQATSLCPDTGPYWLTLGSARVKLGNRDGARTAYKHALSAFEDAAAANKTDPDPALQQVYVLALLGRADDARRLQAKLVDRYPNDRAIRAFVEQKQLDRILSDPQFKDVAL